MYVTLGPRIVFFFLEVRILILLSKPVQRCYQLRELRLVKIFAVYISAGCTFLLQGTNFILIFKICAKYYQLRKIFCVYISSNGTFLQGTNFILIFKICAKVLSICLNFLSVYIFSNCTLLQSTNFILIFKTCTKYYQLRELKLRKIISVQISSSCTFLLQGTNFIITFKASTKVLSTP